MTLTAVQSHLPSHSPRGRIVFGDPFPLRTLDGNLGPLALFGPGALVAYELRAVRRRRLFVFRTLVADDPLAAAIPGVHRRVQLLLHLRAPGRVARALRLFMDLEDVGCSPSRLSDTFYARLGATLEGRIPPMGVLASLLPDASVNEPVSLP